MMSGYVAIAFIYTTIYYYLRKRKRKYVGTRYVVNDLGINYDTTTLLHMLYKVSKAHRSLMLLYFGKACL